MPEKRGFGNNSRNEGYKGASRGSKPAGSYGSRPADSRGPRSAGSKGPRSTDARGPKAGDSKSPETGDSKSPETGNSRGPGAADSRSGGQSDFRSGLTTGARGFGSGDTRGSKPLGDRFGKPSGDRFGKPSRDRFGKPAGERYGKPEGNRFDKPVGDRYGKPEGDRFGKPAGNRFGKPSGDRYGKPAGDRYGKPSGDRCDKPAEERFSKPAEERYDKPSGTRGPRLSDAHSEDLRAPKREHIKEERILAEDDFSVNQGDLDKLEGRNSVLEALKAGRSINKIFVAKGDREGSVSQILAIAREKHILVQEIDRVKLDAMSVTFAHQGVIALTAAKDYVEVDDILASAAESGRPPFLIILDEITDSHNFGSILRTANAAGVHGVIIPKRRAIGLTSVVSKASAGAIEYVPVARVTNIVQTIENLKKQNIWVVGTDSSGDRSYFDRDLTGPVALVIGSEGEGMGKLIRESCDFVVNIPMMGQISSLNAAVAGAIVTYEILRQRSKKQP
jgi:23S rRNA (guanosine2251-2'-O)-methyltransferase